MNQSSAQRNPVEELAEEFLRRYRQGERPSLSEYTAKHPELADEIREVFPALAVLEEAGIGQPPSHRDELHGSSPPRRLDDYRIVRELRRGGMATVYEAVQESLARRVALKVLPRGASQDPLRLARFRREAKAAARLHHTNIVPVFDVGESAGNFYYAMQFIQGQALDEVLGEVRRLRRAETPPADGPAAPAGRVEGGPVAAESCLGLAGALVSGQFALAGGCPAATEEIAAGERECLNQAPGNGPSDVRRTTGGTLVDSPAPPAADAAPLGAADNRPRDRSASDVSGLSTESNRQYYRSVARIGWQVAEALSYAHAQRILHRDIKPSNLLLDVRGTVWVADFGLVKDDGGDLTQTGDVVGTLRYMAPERFTGESDARGDLYSLGVTLYELLTLRPAFSGSDRLTLLARIEEEEPPAPRKLIPEMPRDLDTIVRKAMAKRPADRYASAAALAEDLQRFLDDRPILARRPRPWEQFGRWCRRNPLAAALLMLLLVTVVLGFAGVSWKWREAEAARRSERAARDDADHHAQQRRQAFDDLLAAQRWLERGRRAADERRWDDAALAFTRAIERRPEHQGAWDARGHLYARLGLWDWVRRDWQQAFDLRAPEVGWKWLLLGLTHLDAGDRDAYLRLCARMRERFSGTRDPMAAMELVRLNLALPDPNVDVSELAELAQAVTRAYPNVDWFPYAVGMAEQRAGRDEQAVKTFRDLLDKQVSWPGREASYPLLALACHRLGRSADALAALKQADEVRDRWLEATFQLADGNRWATHEEAEPRWPVYWSDWLEFRVNYQRACLELRGAAPPDDPRLSVLRARALAPLGDKPTADRIYAAALAARPGDPQVLLEMTFNRAYMAVHAGDWGAAAKHFTVVSEQRPDDARLWTFRVSARLAAGDTEGYRRDCQSMFDRFSATTEPHMAHDLVSSCVLGPQALPDMERLVPVARLAADWQHGNVRMLGAALYRAGEYQAALDSFAEAARLIHLTAWDWCFCALAHQCLGNHAEARRYLAQAETWMQEAADRGSDDIRDEGPSWGGMGQIVETHVLIREARRSGTL
ncbi:MAG TPA: protein kinase [Pirellulales bacterium]